MSYERSNIRAMTGYASGEQPGSSHVIKLNTNENPYPPGPGVAAALSGITVAELRRYPPPLANEFRQAAAAYHKLELDNIIATNGGDELLRLAFTTFLEPGQAVGMAEPGYSLYPVLADIHGSPVVRIPLDDSWAMGEDFASRLNDAGAGLAFVVNPHAPSGRLSGVEQIRAIAREFNGVLVLDEAYVDFVDPDLQYDATALAREFDNVLILRTMSKGYSLAGLRFAYGVGSASLLEPMLHKTRDSYNTDYISQKLATAALTSHQEAAETWRKVRQERGRMSEALARLGFSCLPSQSNFLLVSPPAGTPAQMLYQRLKEAGILVRYFDQPRLADKLRITIGTAEENDQLLLQLRACLSPA